MQERIELTITRLSDVERDALMGYAARATWPSGFQIYERGAVADGVFVVVHGRVVLRSRVRAGRAFVPWIATPGETFGAEGFSSNAVYTTDARADEETETLFLSSAKFRAFVREQPTHAISLIGQILSERSALLDKLRELTTLSVEQRLVAALQRMAAHDSFLHTDGRIELGSAHYRLLCELVGATRESVSLVLGRLTGEGFVERAGNTLYVVPSARLFERLSGGAADAMLVRVLSDASNSGRNAIA
ncbi:MAG: Crp/Fnr family transcriptional regulator [Gemmatimonadaceae bacterium]